MQYYGRQSESPPRSISSITFLNDSRTVDMNPRKVTPSYAHAMWYSTSWMDVVQKSGNPRTGLKPDRKVSERLGNNGFASRVLGMYPVIKCRLWDVTF